MARIDTNLQQAAQLLSEGALVAIPTETVYGLAANALNREAVLSIFDAKNRPHFDPLIVHCANTNEAWKYVTEVHPLARELAHAFWPGPLTLVLPKAGIIPDEVTSGLDTVGVRVPDHALTLELLNLLPFPLAAPSANPFGFVSPTTAQHVQDQLGKRIPLILDGGPTEVGIESTIVGFEGDVPVIYRLGGLDIEVIAAIAGPIKLSINQSSNPVAPGQLKSHYAPRIPVFILGDALPPELIGKRYGLLGFDAVPTGTTPQTAILLSPTANVNEAAHNLFDALRSLGNMDLDAILAVRFPDQGLGRAINDRLMRAAAR